MTLSRKLEANPLRFYAGQLQCERLVTSSPQWHPQFTLITADFLGNKSVKKLRFLKVSEISMNFVWMGINL